jgi:putative transposase
LLECLFNSWQYVVMPRPPRADEANGLYHALNRGNGQARIFRKKADYEAFERILAEGLARYDLQLLCFQLMPNHWNLVVRPAQNGAMCQFLQGAPPRIRCVTTPMTARWCRVRLSGEIQKCSDPGRRAIPDGLPIRRTKRSASRPGLNRRSDG